jgi:hypothetical protein
LAYPAAMLPRMNPKSVSRRAPGARSLRLASAATTLLIAIASLPVAAQMGGPGGMGPGGMGSGAGARPGGGGGGGGRDTASSPQEQPTLDDLMAPDPWRIWLDRLQVDSPRLALTPPQQPLFDALLNELDLASQFNAQRVSRAVRYRPNSVSALIDISRDLRKQSEEAQDWVGALTDLSQRWEALRAALNPEQQALVDAAYRAARDFNPAGGRGGRPPGGKSAPAR